MHGSEHERIEMHTKFHGKYLKERAHLEDLGIKGDLVETGWENENWIHLAQDRTNGRFL
jgi:hypothetical protein